MKHQIALIPNRSGYRWDMAQVTEKRPDGTAVVVVPPNGAADLEVGEVVNQRASGRQQRVAAAAVRYLSWQAREALHDRRDQDRPPRRPQRQDD